MVLIKDLFRGLDECSNILDAPSCSARTELNGLWKTALLHAKPPGALPYGVNGENLWQPDVADDG